MKPFSEVTKISPALLPCMERPRCTQGPCTPGHAVTASAQISRLASTLRCWLQSMAGVLEKKTALAHRSLLPAQQTPKQHTAFGKGQEKDDGGNSLLAHLRGISPCPADIKNIMGFPTRVREEELCYSVPLLGDSSVVRSWVSCFR